jgi:hypothetical protein
MPTRKPDEKAGLSNDQENALLAIEQAMGTLKAHGDDLSQWRLMQLERALKALDLGQHRTALGLVDRAMAPAGEIGEADRREAERLERRLELEQLKTTLAALRARR